MIAIDVELSDDLGRHVVFVGASDIEHGPERVCATSRR
jgi:hypothetical protein